MPKLTEFHPMSDKEILKIMNEMPTKYCELDAIPIAILKKLAPYIRKTITRIVNISLTEGKFPSQWRIASIKLLLKKLGLELLAKNYRPVNNLSFLSKLVEKCMLSQFNSHCKLNGLIPGYQLAYRAFHSCETSLINICNEALWSMVSKKVTAPVMMDLSTAFDTVDHQIFLDVLNKRFGIAESALSWFSSYLEKCQFYVSIQNQHSILRTLPYGVLQGSCAGPIAFTAYSSTLETVVHKIKESNGSNSTDSIILNGFADDHSLSKAFSPDTNKAKENTIRILEHGLYDISHWMAMNWLKMNPTKTDFIYLGSRVQVGICLEQTISVCGDSIEHSEVIKLYSVHINKHLSFKYHIGVKCKPAMYNLLRIKYIRRHLTQEVAQILVSSLVMSHLDYANSLLCGLPACDIDKLQCVQNCAAKLVLNRSKYGSRTQAFIDLHWLPIHTCIANKILTVVYNCLNQEALKYLMDMLTQKFLLGMAFDQTIYTIS